MKNTLLLLLSLPAAAFFLGIRKLNEFRDFVGKLQIKAGRIYDIKLDVLKNTATFLADFTITNPTDYEFNVQTAGLVKITRILFYDKDGSLVASAELNVTSFDIAPGGSFGLPKVPFTTRITGGIARLQEFLRSKNNTSFRIVMELQAFNKTYTTNLN